MSVNSMLKEEFRLSSTELLMRDFERDETSLFCWERRKTEEIKLWVNNVRELQSSSAEEYENIIDGKIIHPYMEKEEIIYELPGGNKEAWKKLFKTKK